MPQGYSFDEKHWTAQEKKFIKLCSAAAQSIGTLEKEFGIYATRALRKRCAKKITIARAGRETVVYVNKSPAEKKHRAAAEQ